MIRKKNGEFDGKPSSLLWSALPIRIGFNRSINLICVSNFIWFFGDGLFTFLLPVYIRQLGASPAEVGLLYAFFFLSNGLSVLAGGFLADKLDRKKILILSSLSWLPVPLMMAVATNWNQLVIPMILYGTFFDGPATSVYLAKSTRRDKLMFTYALWSASVSLGSIFSPSLGGFLASTIGMQAVFLIAFAFYFGSMCPLFFIKNQPPVEDVTPTMPSSENRSSKTLLVLICCFFSVAMFSIFMLNPLIPQFEDEVYNQSFLNIGIFGAVTSAGSALFSIIIGKIGDKWTKMAAIASSLIITSFSFLLLILFNNFLFLCVASLLTGASAPILYFMVGIIASIAPKRFEGRWVSIAQMAVTIAGFVAPIVGGVLYEFSPSVPFYLLIVTAPCLAAVALAFSKHLRSE